MSSFDHSVKNSAAIFNYSIRAAAARGSSGQRTNCLDAQDRAVLAAWILRLRAHQGVIKFHSTIGQKEFINLIQFNVNAWHPGGLRVWHDETFYIVLESGTLADALERLSLFRRELHGLG